MMKRFTIVLRFSSILAILTGSLRAVASPAGAHFASKRPSAPIFPLDFIENQGQWNTPARFVARSGSTAFLLNADSIELIPRNASRSRIVLTFENASPLAELRGGTSRETCYHFFTGSEPSAWHTDVSAYATVVNHGLYDSIDLRVREESGRLEYDLLLAPNADLARVVVRAEGANGLSIAGDGSLVLATSAGPLRQSQPRTWEQLPDGGTRPISCRFRRIDDDRYGFEAPTRDRSLALVIDPGVEWGTYLGGSGSEQMTAVALARDGSGDFFVAGYMNSHDFPFFSDANFSAHQDRVFVARLDSTGAVLRWAAFLGGWHSQVIYRGLAAAPDGGVVVAGQTNSPDFPTTPGAFQRTAKFEDAFVARFNAAGGLSFSTFLGGVGNEHAYAVGLDPSGNIIVGGSTSSTDFPTTTGAFDRTYASPSDASQGDAHGDVFISRLNPDGTALTYSTYIGGRSADVLEDMEVDPLGFVNLAGWITGHNIEIFPTTANAFDSTWNGSQDALFARLKLDGAGAADLKYATVMGGVGQDNFYAVAVDPVNPELVTLAGATWSSAFPVTAGVFKTTNPPFSALFDSQNGVVSRFHFPASGAPALLWSTYVGPPNPAANIRITDAAVNSLGEPIVVGLMGDRNWPTTRGAFDRTPEGRGSGAGGGEIIARFSANAAQLLYSSYIGGTGGNVDQFYMSPRLAWIGGNTVLVAGTTESVDFPVTTGAYDTALGSLFNSADGFAMRFTTEPDASGDLMVGVPTPAGPPNGATLPSGTFMARLQWGAVSDPAGIDGYEFQLSSQPTFPSNFIQYAGTAHNTDVILPPPGTGEQGLALIQWHWRVRAVDRAGNVGGWSTASNFTLNGANPPPAVWYVDTYPRSVVGGASSIGVLHLDKPAPAGGMTVTLLLRYNESVGYLAPHVPIPVTVPATINLPAGTLSVLFDIATFPVTRTSAADIIALANGLGRAASLTVKTPTTGIVTTDLFIRPATVTGGNPSTGLITIKSPAPPGGQVVDLVTSHPQAARVPATVIIPEGARQAAFPITTLPIQFDIDSYVDASTPLGLQRQFIFVKRPGWPALSSFTLSPGAANGGQTVTGSIGFSGVLPASIWPASDDAKVSVFCGEPNSIFLQPFITVPSGTGSATFTFTPRSFPSSASLTLFAVYDNVTLSAPLVVNAGPPVTLASVTVNAPVVSPGQGGVATATLAAPAPAGGITVAFTTSHPAIFFSSEPIAFIGQGSLTGSVAYIANPVAASTPVNIIATYGASNASTTVTVNTADTAARWPTSVTLSPTSVTSGSASTGTVTISSPAPAGGLSVLLSTSNSAASTPASVTVPAGATSANFSVTTTSVTSTTTVAVYALLNISMAGALTITAPPAPPPTPSAPSLLSPANQATVAQPITFDWTDAANAATYNIQIDNSSNFTTPLTLSQTVSVSQATISGLAAQQHWWRVRGINSAGVFGPFSSSRRFTAQSAPTAPTLSAISLNPTSVVGGNASQGTATLTSAAPTGGAVVSLSSGNTAVATVPASVTIPAGSTSVTFSVSTVSVASVSSAVISGVYSATTRTATLTVNPVPPPASLSSISLSPTSVTGGGTSQGTATLTSAAPSGGAVVALSSGNTAAATVPASVTIAAGSTSANFTVNTLSVATSTNVTISGVYNAVTRTATLTVNPVPTGPLPAPSLVSPANDARFSPGQSITFDWSDVSGAANYLIQIDDNNSFPSPHIVAQTVTPSQYVTSTLPTTTMWWRVRANDASGNPGNWSSVRRVEVKN